MDNPVAVQRIEGAAVFAAATVLYFQQGFSWIFYILLLFAFDIFMLGYMANPRAGAAVYNAGHSFAAPALAAIAYVITDAPWVLALACLWAAHIGLDRAFGYGLKLRSGFTNTHLGVIGRKPKD